VAGERLTNAVAAVAVAEAERDTAAGLDAFLAAAGPFVANLTVLVEALRDREFVDHLVTAREAELIAEADRRLRAITGARFGFVRDFGVVSVASGEVRTPDALSGGERFQAALALALSLVEIASRGRGRLEAVFVDEGFGSLDSRSLDAALATLGEVAGGGKMVGLISHLKPVAEAVETVLLVTKDDVRGSVVERLDAEAREQMLDDDIRSGLTA
jgi:exonuclease SbcC